MKSGEKVITLQEILQEALQNLDGLKDLLKPGAAEWYKSEADLHVMEYRLHKVERAIKLAAFFLGGQTCLLKMYTVTDEGNNV